MSALATTARAGAGAPRTAPLRTLLVPMGCVTLVVAALQSGQYTVIALLLGLAFGSLVLVRNSPVWALVPLLVTELSVSAYIIPQLGLSLRLATVLAALALTGLGILRQGRLLDLSARRVVLP
ncbi:MAG TPA: hypothetical protein VFW96_05230, partial [Thermomicrobiales bacterium]|nr:hypothetical protein [Thermomicrobiales bacterium]